MQVHPVNRCGGGVISNKCKVPDIRSNNKQATIILIVIGFGLFYSIRAINHEFFTGTSIGDFLTATNDHPRALPKTATGSAFIFQTFTNATGQIVIDGNAALDAFCAGNSTDGLTPGTSQVIKNLILDAQGVGSGLVIRNTNRYLVIQNCSIRNSTINEKGAEIFLLNVTHVNVTQCSCFDGGVGIAFTNASQSNLVGNVVKNHSWAGICLYGSRHCLLLENQVSMNKLYGIDLNEAIIGSTVDASGQTIYFQYSTNVTCLGNNASVNEESGFYLYIADHCTLSQNLACQNGRDGILLSSSNNNMISSNNITGNSDYGVELSHSDFNTVTGNIFTDNRKACIYLYYEAWEQWRYVINWNFIYGNDGCSMLVLPGVYLWVIIGVGIVCIAVAHYWRRKKHSTQPHKMEST